MTEEEPATRLPWHQGSKYHGDRLNMGFSDGSGSAVFRCEPDWTLHPNRDDFSIPEKNAAFIVKAVNSYCAMRDEIARLQSELMTLQHRVRGDSE